MLVRERTGVAQEVDASLFNSITWTMVSDIAGTLVTGKDRQAVKRIDRGTPFLNSYRTKDNRWLYLMINRREVFWAKFCTAIGKADLEKDSRFTTDTLSFENSKGLFDILQEGFLTKTLEEWKAILTDVGPWAPVQNLQEVVKDTQARANGFFTSLEHPRHGKIEIMANPVKFSKMPEVKKHPAPSFNQNTEEVLIELGYSPEELQSLKAENVIL